MAAISDYIRAASLAEALALFDTAALPVRLLAGGTDLLPRLQPDSPEKVLALDISDARDLAGIELAGDGLRIGAATRLAEIERSDVLAGPWAALRTGAGLVGSPQIRNLATLGGNICNASPAADTLPPLLILDAQAEIVSSHRKRQAPLSEFFRGPGQTILEAGEILASVLVPRQPSGAVAIYLKHSPRRAMDLAVVGVGALLAWIEDHLEARIALGAVGPTPIRARQAEQLLVEAAQLDGVVIAEAARLAVQETQPISDVRASAEYREAMVKALTERALHRLADDLIRPTRNS